ncbi:MAG: hypothetical protein H8K04_16845 [Nitrospira sp.]
MFGSMALEMAISLSLLYLLLGLMCSVLNEWVAGILNMRARNLWDGVRNLLYDSEGTGLAKQLYNHPLIKNLAKPGKIPSYVPSRTFALAMFDLVAPAHESTKTKTLQDIRNAVATLPNEQIKGALIALIDDAEGDVKKARENVERWYDDAMDRVSGWYKRKTQVFILIWALAVTLSVNADTILIANTLAHDATLRASLVAMAETTAKEPLPQDAKGTTERVQQMSSEIKKLGLPIGWSREAGNPRSAPAEAGDWALKIIGLALTTIAVSLGAPFWFDVLNKLINIRSTGKQPERSREEKEPAPK